MGDVGAGEVLLHLQWPDPDHDVVLAASLTQFLIPFYQLVHLVHGIRNEVKVDKKQTEHQSQ
jgi:hypothetical protein